MTTISETKERPIVLKEPVQRPTRMRYVMSRFLLLATIVSYVDRTNLWIAAPFMSKDLGLDKAQMGQIFAAFGLTYAFALIPGGYIADVFGSRLSYAIALVSWSAATMVQGFTNSFNTLVGTRLAIGALEAPAFPANARAVTMWFPTKERGLRQASTSPANILGTPLFAAILCGSRRNTDGYLSFTPQDYPAWCSGRSGNFTDQDPRDCKRANIQELKYIEAGGGLAANSEKTNLTGLRCFAFSSIDRF